MSIEPTARPQQCPAPDHCRCLWRWHDPAPGEACSTFCTGLRTSNEFPGKAKAIQNIPSDVIVECTIIGSHSEYEGVHTGIMNFEDCVAHMRMEMEALHRIGLLKPVMHSICCRTHLEDDLRKILREEGKIIEIKTGVKMIRVNCSCGEELFKFWKTTWHRFTPEERRWIDAHKTLGHTVKITYNRYAGKKDTAWNTYHEEVL